jgi:hypothetical protein
VGGSSDLWQHNNDNGFAFLARNLQYLFAGPKLAVALQIGKFRAQNMKPTWLFIFYWLLALPSLAQNNYIKAYDDDIIAKTFVNNRGLGIRLSPKGQREHLSYQPNVIATLGVGAVFKRVAVNVGFRLAEESPQHQLRQQQRGDSRYFDLQINRFGRKIGFDIYYQDYKGYYLSNPEDVYGSWRSEVYPHRPDIDLFNFSANVYYVFNNEKFSYRATHVHDEQQNRSAGSFILTGAFAYSELFADSSLVPPVLQPRYGPGFSQGAFYGLSLVPGYAHTFVVKKFYFNLSGSAGFGLQRSRYHLSDEPTRRGLSPFAKFIGRSALGYNGDRFFTGLTFYIDTQTVKLGQLMYGTNITSASLLFGYRFHTKWLKGKKLF